MAKFIDLFFYDFWTFLGRLSSFQNYYFLEFYGGLKGFKCFAEECETHFKQCGNFNDFLMRLVI